MQARGLYSYFNRPLAFIPLVEDKCLIYKQYNLHSFFALLNVGNFKRKLS